MKSFFWKKSAVPEELHRLLETLGREYPLFENEGDIELRFRKNEKKGRLKVSFNAAMADIEYNTLNCAARGTACAIAGIETEESLAFETFGIMLDCSRNAVMKVEHIKKWLRRIALMGYNMAMLYTEETYELPDEPYFGYMRGAYTLAEMKVVDEYASRLGIEMIPCIQTLGHLEKILRWKAYADITDAPSVLLVDEKATYRLIEKMLFFWKEAFKSRRIHIGMDETHGLGRGKFMDKYGYERGFDIFNRHLEKVNTMCRENGFEPMIWSDMYFRMGNRNNAYYDMDTVIPEDVKDAIPEDVTLVYWDYYHDDYNFYSEWIKRHRELGHEPVMASGAWTWQRWWYDSLMTEKTVVPCIEACRDLGINEFFVTLWGDDGAYCEFDSVFAGLFRIAELAFGGNGNADKLEKLFRGIFASSYSRHMSASRIEFPSATHKINIQGIIWDDPLMNKLPAALSVTDKDALEKLKTGLESIISDLNDSLNDDSAAMLKHGYNMARAMLGKIQLYQELSSAYASKDRKALKEIADTKIPELISIYNDFTSSFREQWMRRNKPFGLETIQIRFAGQVARLEETALRITELLDGKIQNIPELEVQPAKDKDRIPAYNLYASSALS